MVRSCDVAVVGGGLGGLTLAASLSQKSVSVQIFEQDTELREIGAGIAICGNATRLLQDLGIDLAQVANMPPALEFRCWKDGGLLWSHPIGEWYRQQRNSRAGGMLATCARSMPRRCSSRVALPPIAIPAPISLSSVSCSKICTDIDFCDRLAPSVRPPMPPPTTATSHVRVISAAPPCQLVIQGIAPLNRDRCGFRAAYRGLTVDLPAPGTARAAPS